MSDEIRAANCGVFDSDSGCGCDNDWWIWIILIIIFFCFIGGDNIFGRRGCCSSR